MSAPAALRRGWCPGALRPMATGDGLLVRPRITGGIVPAALARALADCAQKFGNGFLDLTSRANLQIRGVSDRTLPALFERLSELDLLDDDPDGEAVRNVIAAPLAGLDTTAVLDIRPVVAGLEARLAGDPALRTLPHKFGSLVEDGGAVGLADVAVDLRFTAALGPDGPRFTVALGGTQATAHPVGHCRPGDVPDVAAALALAFLRTRGIEAGAPRRLRDLLRGGRGKLGELLARVDRAVLVPEANPPRRAAARSPRVLGPNRAGDLPYLGVAAPFGRMRADDLAQLADVAQRWGNGQLRLTPWRAVLLPGVEASAAAELGSALILDEGDPRRRVAACPGAHGCLNGSTPTQADGAALAPLAALLAQKGIVLHVSGCPKGCALPRPAPVTLVGRGGRYDLVRDGTAADRPVRCGLTLVQASAALEEMAREPVPA